MECPSCPEETRPSLSSRGRSCRRHALHDAGDHSILVGEVLAATIGSGRPLVHHARRFGAFVLSNEDAQA